MVFPCGSAGKESACNVGDLGSIPGLGRSHGEGNSYPLQYSGLENSMDYIVLGVSTSQAWLSDFHFHFHSWVVKNVSIDWCYLLWELFFLNNLFVFNWRIIALQYCVDFCHISTWISHIYIYICPLHLEPPSHLPPHPTPPGCQSTGLSSLNHIVNSHWLSISRMLVFTFPCSFLHLSNPLLPSLFTQSVLFVCISIAAQQTGSAVLSF